MVSTTEPAVMELLAVMAGNDVPKLFAAAEYPEPLHDPYSLAATEELRPAIDGWPLAGVGPPNAVEVALYVGEAE